mmetsp:Transcript_68996/g.163710  ORF Transcript_68996/g.163710 Transcript_68996/m.163710 type:complete len:243 (+) Transcript_68996:602-1330(+)
MRPNPTIPTVEEWTSTPQSQRGDHVPQDPSLTAARASWIRRAVTSSSVTVKSAVVSVRQSGVYPRRIPRDFRDGVSTWLNPTLMVETILRRSPATSSSPASTLSVSRTRRPSNPPAIRFRSSSAGMGESALGYISTSRLGASRSILSATSGRERVTSTRNGLAEPEKGLRCCPEEAAAGSTFASPAAEAQADSITALRDPKRRGVVAEAGYAGVARRQRRVRVEKRRIRCVSFPQPKRISCS